MTLAARSLLLVMRVVIALAITAVLSTAGATAQDSNADAELDVLFAQLRVAPDPAAAQAISDEIWLRWITPSDPDLARKMAEAIEAGGFRDYGNAIRLYTDIVAEYPDYAEAWNQRATMYFYSGNLDASLADCEKVLELEPRHFGALAGRAIIYLQQGKRPLALQDMTRALEIHPFLSERGLFPELQAPTRT